MGIVERDSFRISLIAYAGAVIGYLNKLFLFTNFLTTEQVGLANLIITISLIYAQVSALGSRNIILRFFPFFNDPKNQHHGFLFGIMAFSLAGFTLTTLLFILFRQPLALLYQDSSPLLVEYAVYVIPLGLATLFFNLFESYLRCLYNNIIPSVTHEVILRLLVTVSVSLFAVGIISFPEFVTIYVLAYCLPAVILISYTAMKGWLQVRPAWTPLLRRLAKIMLVYGLYSLLNNLSTFLLISIDSLMVGGMIDLGTVGIYTTMIFISSVMLIPYRSMVKVSGPLIASYWKMRDMTRMEQVYKKATAANLVVGATLFLLLWINLDSVFQFMPPEYQAGRYIFLLLGIGKLFDMSAGLNATILTTSKKYRYDLFFTIGMVGFAILANYLLIPSLGAEGAALASMLTLLLFNIVRLVYIYMHFDIQPFEWKHLWVPVLLVLLMVASGQVDRAPHVLTDITLRSIIAATLFLLPVWKLRISEDLNLWVGKLLWNISKFFKRQ
ncbi:MAG: polysaccharide biosynthesis C-terminal domain-containing protein [Bacteroidales bacterium]